jgi:hypothetical protein
VTFDGGGNIGATAFRSGSSVYGSTSASVAGQISAGSHFLAAQGGPSGAGYSFAGDIGADTGMFSPSDGDLELYADNLDALSITTSAITAHEAISAPSLSLTTALAKSSGGTGTGSPATTAGPGIDISGSWPNQTFSTTTQIINGTCISGGGSTCTISTANQILGALCNVEQSSPYANADFCFVDSSASNFSHGSLVIASAQVTGVGGQSAGTGAGVGLIYTIFTNNSAHL